MTLDLGGRFDIRDGERLTLLDAGAAQAFRAVDKKSGDDGYVAYILGHAFAPQLSRLEPMIALQVRGMTSLLDQGVVQLADGRRRFATIWHLPNPEPLVRSLEQTFEPMGESFLIDGIVRSVLPALRDLELHKLTHRSIRPTNLFVDSANRKHVVLGPFGLGPPAYDQPDWIEPLDSAVADPDGRGPGSLADDLFALGETLVFLAQGGSPLKRVGQTELLHRRMTLGSFEVLTAGRRLPTSVHDLARGLLVDNAKERWDLKDIELWLDGRSPTLHRTVPLKAAGRPFAVGDRQATTARALADALSTNWDTAAIALKSEDFVEWLRRALTDGAVNDKIAKGLRDALSLGKGEAMQDSMIALSCAALDPSGPMRFRSLAVMPDGIADALAATLAKAEPSSMRVDDFVAIIRSGAIKRIIASQPDPSREAFAFGVLAEKLRDVVASRDVAFGIERCLYEVNPQAHCLSPLLIEHCVISIGDLLPVLDALPADRISPGLLTDKHLISFIACRCPQMSAKLLGFLEKEVGSLAHLVGSIRVLAQVQVSSGNGPVPNLTKRLGPFVKAAVETTVHSVDLKQRLMSDLDVSMPSGRLDRLCQPFTDATLLDRDGRAFLAAALEHGRNREILGKIKEELAEITKRAQVVGPQIASGVSIATALVAAGVLMLSLHAF
jgi:hypothetical protein